MEFTTRFELHSQTTRLVEGCLNGLGPRRIRGSHPIVRFIPKDLRPSRDQTFLCRLQRRRRPAFKSELLPLHSPLLRQSLLVSFPPLIDMLKFSGYPHLIRGHTDGLSSPAEKEAAILSRMRSAFGRRNVFRPLPSREEPTQGWALGLKRRSNRCAPRNAKGRNVRSKIR